MPLNGWKTRDQPNIFKHDKTGLLSSRKGDNLDFSDFTFISGTNERYIITKDAIIYDLVKRKQIVGYESKQGYIYCGIIINNEYKTCAEHRLVAEAFIPNPENKPQVNHRDANKAHNCAYNLEWATSQENMDHVSANRLNKTSRQCCMVSESNEIIKVYPSMHNARILLKIDNKCVNSSCKGISKFANSYRIRFYDEENKTFIATKFDDENYDYKSSHKQRIFCSTNNKIYESQCEAARDLPISQPDISKYLRSGRECGYEFIRI